MTPSTIDATPAGPEMDARVAALVMRLDEVKTYPDGRVLYRRVEDVGSAVITTVHPVPPYSRSDAASLEVLPFLIKKLGAVWVECDKSGYGISTDGGWNNPEPFLMKSAPTLALAICRAALKAVAK